ncbi:MAG: polysaccharide export protein [Elainella sp. Prado103]|nr:polysaccharide export protein [Elainella sp. Prado103]
MGSSSIAHAQLMQPQSRQLQSRQPQAPQAQILPSETLPFETLPSETLPSETLPSQPAIQLQPIDQSPLRSSAEASLSLESVVFPLGYALGSGDQVEITVFGYEEYAGTHVILPDGTIALPVLGTVQASGLTPQQLAQSLTIKLQSLLVDPVVTVNLSQLRSVNVTVAGAVQRPGPIRFDRNQNTSNPDEVSEMPVVASALMQAGGVTQNADIRQVTLRRSLPNGEVYETTINLWDAITNGSVLQNFALQDGDSVYVPQLAHADAIDRRLLSRSSFAPETIRVRVVGEVKQPGEILVPPDGSLASAVAIAGGPTADARLSEVVYVHRNESGEIERQIIDLSNLTDDYQIQAGDVVIVPKKNVSSVLDFAARLVGPLGLLLGIPGMF